MAIVDLVMPKMGESVMEGTILNWLKEVGEEIEQDEAVLEVATDKVDTEIPSTHSGILKEILAQEGDVIQVGSPIARIETQGDVPGHDSPSQSELPSQDVDLGEAVQNIEQTMSEAVQVSNGFQTLAEPQPNRFYSPLVMNIATQENISPDELALIPGSGMENRVTKHDILAYVEQKKSGSIAQVPVSSTPAPAVSKAKANQPSKPTPASTPAKPSPAPTMSASVNGAHEIIEMDRMRKMIAQRMVESKQISPHVTTFVEVDVSNIVMWRNKVKNEFQKREGEKITFTPIFMEAVVQALKDFPMVNISVDGDRIIRKKDINLGMAAALPSGNLIVPVIHQADQMNLLGLTKKVNDLARRARENKLKPDELSNGTYTVSNIGSFGNEMGTPIIMQPQVAILALGSIKKKPAVLETPQGDVIAIRHMMFISHAYDHRVIDGALGGSFARRVADYLENFDMERTI